MLQSQISFLQSHYLFLVENPLSTFLLPSTTFGTKVLGQFVLRNRNRKEIIKVKQNYFCIGKYFFPFNWFLNRFFEKRGFKQKFLPEFYKGKASKFTG